MSLVVVLVSVGAACSDSNAKPLHPERSVGHVVVRSGELYLVAGERDSSADLYRVRAGDPTPERITRFAPGPGISSVTVGSGQVMVSAAPQLTDKIYKLVDHRLELFIDGRVFTPALSNDGRLAYTQLRFAGPGSGAAQTFAIVVRDVTTGDERTVYESPLPTFTGSGRAWSADGSIVLGQNDADFQTGRILIAGPDGQAQRLDSELPSPADASWSSGGWLAVNDRTPGQAEIVNPRTGEHRRLPAGWTALEWSPDGSSLLVRQERRLGLVSLSDASRVEPIGEMQLPVHDVAWAEG